METYHRKRSKRATISTNHEIIMSLKRQETSNVLLDGAPTQSPPLARQLLLHNNDENEDVELGSVYEIYHKNLPPRTPVHLRSTRVVMVSEKTELNVAIRYPSILSLRNYFSNGITEMYPALDEKFVMGIKLASQVLLRQVPSQEFAEKKHLQDFWLVNPISQVGSSGHLVMKHEEIGLARELKNNEMVRWGVRRQVMFIGRHKEMSKTQSSSSYVQGEEVKDQQEIRDEEYEEVEEEVDDEADQEEKDDEADMDEGTQDDNLKRKLKSTRNLRKRKRVKQVNQLWQANKKPMKKCKKLALRDPTDRWSKERYMAAEQSLLEAMMEKKAMIGNPITRPALRVEARKRIGDTGLLDHLLKHVANKVAPGGTLRFRRSHNADGAMEYWLESADLLKIRKDAGVNDPFWTPPPGWKPGDSPIQDPIMAKEINILKEEISNMKREKKLLEEEMASMRRDMEELLDWKNKQQRQGSKAIVVREDDVDMSPKQVLDVCNSLLPPVVSREECKKQMLVISKKIKAEVGKEAANMTKPGTELITAQKDSKKDNNEAVELLKEAAAGDQETSGGELAAPAAEGKAAKIERLKSGFRLCRPQGTFLWPNMLKNPTTSSATFMSSSQVVVQVDDLMVVPTPPSVNSSTAASPPQLPYHHHHLASPVKPVPERRPVTVTTVSTVSDGPNEEGGNNYSSTTTLINLNDIPTNPSNSVACGVMKSGPWEAAYRKSSSSSASAWACATHLC